MGDRLPRGAQEDRGADAFAAGLISITPLDGDMTAGGPGARAVEDILGGLTP